MERYTVKINKNALKMMDRHLMFLADINVDAAKRLADELTDSLVSLETMPNRCPKFRTHRTDEPYRQLIVGRYQIIFSINEEKNIVSVKHILDSRQNNDI